MIRQVVGAQRPSYHTLTAKRPQGKYNSHRQFLHGPTVPDLFIESCTRTESSATVPTMLDGNVQSARHDAARPSCLASAGRPGSLGLGLTSPHALLQLQGRVTKYEAKVVKSPELARSCPATFWPPRLGASDPCLYCLAHEPKP